jgi:hypothetical protein
MPSTAGRTQYKTALGQPSFDELVPQGPPVVDTPFQELNRNHHVITQTYMVRRAGYQKPAENHRMPRDILPELGVVAYHCFDGPRAPVGVADLITFERTWATIPANFVDNDNPFTVSVQLPSIAQLRSCYQFNGFPSPVFNFAYYYTNFGIVATGDTVDCTAKNQRDFYLIGAGGTYGTTAGIPARNESIAAYRDWTALAIGTEYREDAWDTTVAALPVQNVGLLSGYLSLPAKGYPPAIGSRNCSLGSGSGLAAGTYVYGNSKLYRYIGNIWERRSVNAVVV